MNGLRRLKLTQAIYSRMAIVEASLEHVSGGGYGPSWSAVDMLKAEFADEVMAAIREQGAARQARLDRLAALPRPEPVPFVEVRLQPKRRRA